MPLLRTCDSFCDLRATLSRQKTRCDRTTCPRTRLTQKPTQTQHTGQAGVPRRANAPPMACATHHIKILLHTYRGLQRRHGEHARAVHVRAACTVICKRALKDTVSVRGTAADSLTNFEVDVTAWSAPGVMSETDLSS